MKVSPDLFSVEITETPEWRSTREQFDQAAAKFEGVPWVERVPFNPDEEYNREVIKETKFVLSGDQLLQLAVANIAVKVLHKIDVQIDITRQIIEMAEKPVRLIQEVGGKTEYNNKCEVHMPGSAMALYNEMMLKEDCCTDEMQGCLNSGWRLVAVCPQPEQRRPDYILGRFNPDYEACGGAAR